MSLITYKGYTFDEGTNEIISLWDYNDDGDVCIRYVPSPTVKNWLQSPVEEHGMIGGRGSGKSVALAYKCMEICNTYPGINGIIIRKVKDDLKDSTFKTFLDTIPPELIAFHHEKSGVIHIACNGDPNTISIIQFLGADRQKQQQKWRGRHFGFFCVEEAQEFPALQGLTLYTELKIAMRQPGYPRYFAMTVGNPAGQNWQYKLYRDKNGNNLPNKELYIVSTIENAHNLPLGYIQKIIDSYPPELVKRYIEGSCDVADGLVFKEFGDANIINSWEYPLRSDWRAINSIDPSPGVVTPFACIFVAIDNRGNYIAYDEYYELGDRLQPHADGILAKMDRSEKEGIDIETTLIDHQANTKTREKDHGTVSVRTDLLDYGLPTINANKNIREGINRMIELIHPNPKNIHVTKNQSPAPRLYIYRDKCPNFIRQLNNYMWDQIQDDGSESPKEHQEDHLIDGFRYVVNHTFEFMPDEEEEKESDILLSFVEEGFQQMLEDNENEKGITEYY